MSKILLLAFLIVVLIPVGSALADDPIPSTLFNWNEVSISDPNVALADTTLIMGPMPGAIYDGTFDFPYLGKAMPPGWSGVDLTAPDGNHWEIWDDEGRVLGYPNHAAACRYEFGSDWGYGNNWFDPLEWRWDVIDTGQPVSLTVSFNLLVDLAGGDDYLDLGYRGGNCCEVIVETWQGQFGTPEIPDLQTVAFDIPAGKYCDGQIVLFFRLSSDGYISDGDGLFNGDGGCWLDNVTVTDVGVPNTFGLPDLTDFENDMWFGNWTRPVPEERFGDYAEIWDGLEDIVSSDNLTKQAAFIDQSDVQPCTVSDCVSWCYGPGATVPNTTRGLPGRNDKLHNGIVSPIMAWKPGDNRAKIAFDVYVHEQLGGDSKESPGIYFDWAVRSTTSANSADILDAMWMSDREIYYGGPKRLRMTRDVSIFLDPGRTFFQVMLKAWDWHDPTGPDPSTATTPHPGRISTTLRSNPGPARRSCSGDRATPSRSPRSWPSQTRACRRTRSTCPSASTWPATFLPAGAPADRFRRFGRLPDQDHARGGGLGCSTPALLGPLPESGLRPGRADQRVQERTTRDTRRGSRTTRTPTCGRSTCRMNTSSTGMSCAITSSPGTSWTGT